MKISFLQIVLISCLFVSHLLKRPSRSLSLSLSLSFQSFKGTVSFSKGRNLYNL